MNNSHSSSTPVRTVGRRHDDGRFISLEEALANPDLCSIERYPALGRLPNVTEGAGCCRTDHRPAAFSQPRSCGNTIAHIFFDVSFLYING